jgi:Zn-finger nucleic acid-binding protein
MAMAQASIVVPSPSIGSQHERLAARDRGCQGRGMRCPRCQAETQVADTGRCASCRGAWLTEDVVAKRVAKARDPRTAELAWTRVERPALPCGACGAAMQTLELFGVPLDRCAAHGVWFDADELDEVVRRARPEQEKASTTALDTILDLFWRS